MLSAELKRVKMPSLLYPVIYRNIAKRLTRKAKSNGIVIHLAADADEAVQIVLKIAEETHCRLIAKSKTMVSEEIGLNHALEAAGYQVDETDLGEYIIQLRGEPRSTSSN